ncbi:hypothetical protein [Actinoplanes sp. NPDC051494]|uniref:hypothetical protein n=1 Tax=Actinoplanes sp. NPDC051494 TaxID=3363907 RepID=UPI0037ADD94D
MVAGKREKAAAAVGDADRGLARAQQQAVADHEAADNRARQDHAAHAVAQQRTTKAVAEAAAVLARALAAVDATRSAIEGSVLDARQRLESAGDALQEAEAAATGHLGTMRAETSMESPAANLPQATVAIQNVFFCTFIGLYVVFVTSSCDYG